jgi:DtxR family manganese transport transcriptional regulator
MARARKTPERMPVPRRGRGVTAQAGASPGNGRARRLLPAEEQAGHFRQARQARATQTTEDYVEMIADLIDSAGEARVVDIARCLGVTHVTVIRTIGRLKDDDLVTMKPYRAIFLTPRGRQLAERVRERHQTVLRFLEAIGVSPGTARTDAEGIEHHVSRETLAAFERFISKRHPA